ncbi:MULTISPECIES: hypothetical protein [Nocardiopsidaceae]|uniref:Uncharacterized protein n=1 Tax=Streptomonospora nanhaiensis TaxID=1323731 RepID=A0ABY6YLX1_9ACTN|nr:hypothetical protein [Streptomonospora nanhaiensis]WAE73364.1 hypothetical protein OUQ99_30220 [Streptomonospora nanhaiensis]
MPPARAWFGTREPAEAPAPRPDAGGSRAPREVGPPRPADPPTAVGEDSEGTDPDAEETDVFLILGADRRARKEKDEEPAGTPSGPGTASPERGPRARTEPSSDAPPAPAGPVPAEETLLYRGASLLGEDGPFSAPARTDGPGEAAGPASAAPEEPSAPAPAGGAGAGADPVGARDRDGTGAAADPVRDPERPGGGAAAEAARAPEGTGDGSAVAAPGQAPTADPAAPADPAVPESFDHAPPFPVTEVRPGAAGPLEVTGFLDIPAAPYTEGWRSEPLERPDPSERFEGLAGFEQAHEPATPERSAWSTVAEAPAQEGPPEARPADVLPEEARPGPAAGSEQPAAAGPTGLESWIEAAGTAGAVGPTVTEVAAMAAVAASDGHVPVPGGFEQRIAAVRPVPASAWKRAVFGATGGRLNLG